MILLYFGSFNPIHNGHIALAQYALENIADEVWLVLSPHNPLKESSLLWSEELRYELASAACAPIEGCKVCDIEFSLPKPNYTYITLQTLSNLYPNEQFALLIGQDNYEKFGKWRDYEKILAQYPIYVYPRGDINQADRSLYPQMHWIEAPLLDISSTQIRESLAKGESIDNFVPQAVAEIISKVKL